ncbi:RluA family pseudouridine synthase [Bacillus pumilus]|uniref:Pseudouridine synthase n=1 Tax=Bacillus pumilus (strain SAFR-032) TaxID=315750 RepID=A8FBD9_BACP2|nr:RluA family pseudouridine synthase [Bacillus pumilus]ABV61556.1 pseudouridine synthase [Bacillus pumilus SAFR-032]MBC3642275.1 RluA family pseudouridine synthase [Bacillus pumilus]MBC3647508.1 RluA family pseudouridine synthase [Bacillus pumilus]MBC3651572.1 RluA family pseudouridine synthase [Bacillus pumilus]MBC3653106.1 RluA family pseudouridine synthase [Bacillus pumilus]
MIIKGHTLSLKVDEQYHHTSLSHFLKTAVSASKPIIHFWMEHQKVRLNQKPAHHAAKVSQGDQIIIDLFETEESDVTPEYGELEVLFEDEHLLIVQKPAGRPTHPNEQGQTGTLANLVAFHFQANGEEKRVRHIHRLDQDTSGTVIFAKHRLAHAALDQMLSKKTIKRTYIAIAEGLFKKKKGTIDAAIGRDKHHAVRRRISPTGQKAVTHFQVMDVNKRLQLTAVKLQLETGRTHQIRVHLSSLGHPLAGDTLYDGVREYINRCALHAKQVDMKHPFTGEHLIIEAPLPPDMDQLMSQIIH